MWLCDRLFNKTISESWKNCRSAASLASYKLVHNHIFTEFSLRISFLPSPGDCMISFKFYQTSICGSVHKEIYELNKAWVIKWKRWRFSVTTALNFDIRNRGMILVIMIVMVMMITIMMMMMMIEIIIITTMVFKNVFRILIFEVTVSFLFVE